MFRHCETPSCLQPCVDEALACRDLLTLAPWTPGRVAFLLRWMTLPLQALTRVAGLVCAWLAPEKRGVLGTDAPITSQDVVMDHPDERGRRTP